MKNVNLDEASSFFYHVYLGCVQRECKPNETMIEEYTKMFESRISAGATEKLLGWEKPHAQTVAWSYEMDGHAQKNALSVTVNWQTRKLSYYTKFQVLAWMIINSRRKNLNQLENCLKYAHKLY